MKNSVKIYPRPEDLNLSASQILPSIEQWETEDGRELPRDYRHFLLTYFGGFPFPSCFDVSVEPWPEFLDENPQVITDFYPWTYVNELIETKYFYDGYPEGYLVIGEAVSPILLLVGIREDNFGKLFLWYNSTVDWGSDVNNESSLVFVSNSFAELIQNLYDGDPERKRMWYEDMGSSVVKSIEL